MTATSSPTPRVLIVSGLRREAAIAAGPDAITVCGDEPTLRARLAELAGLPVRMVVSFGICGGLDPTLRSGDIVLGTEVVSGRESLVADAALAQALERRFAGLGARVVLGRIAASDAPVLTAEAKAKLRAATGAVAVDMESRIAARLAVARGAPLAILRAVSDPAERNLPPLVLNAIRPDGGANIGAVIRGLVGSPAQLPGLLAAAFDSAAALRALRRCRGIDGLFLGLGALQL